MEPSKILGCKEEYSSSSVSGWTMYIGSPVHDDDDDYAHEQRNYYKKDKYDDDDDDVNAKSDDSMASDASSGPSHHELPWGSNEMNLDKLVTSKYSSKEKLNSQKMNKDQRATKAEKDVYVLKAKGVAATRAQSGAKVKKTYLMGKEK